MSAVKARHNQTVPALAHRVELQYLCAFGASVAAFFIVGWIGGPLSTLLPVGQFFHGPTFDMSDTGVLLWANLATNVLATIIPAALFGIGFWVFGRAMQQVGVKGIKPRALWHGAVTVAALLLFTVASDVLLTLGAFSHVTTDNQVMVDTAFFLLTGLWYVVGWVIVRQLSHSK